VLRKDLATVSSRGHLGRWFEGSTCTGSNFVSAKDSRTLLFLENGDMISMNKKKRDLQHGLTILFIICIILTKWSLAHFVELRGLNTST
jgi:hypothetical protein